MAVMSIIATMTANRMKIEIRNGRIVDPVQGTDRVLRCMSRRKVRRIGKAPKDGPRAASSTGTGRGAGAIDLARCASRGSNTERRSNPKCRPPSPAA
jgi:hypothetical protein